MSSKAKQIPIWSYQTASGLFFIIVSAMLLYSYITFFSCCFQIRHLDLGFFSFSKLEIYDTEKVNLCSRELCSVTLWVNRTQTNVYQHCWKICTVKTRQGEGCDIFPKVFRIMKFFVFFSCFFWQMWDELLSVFGHLWFLPLNFLKCYLCLLSFLLVFHKQSLEWRQLIPAELNELLMLSWSHFGFLLTPGKGQPCSIFSPFVENGSHCGSLVCHRCGNCFFNSFL